MVQAPGNDLAGRVALVTGGTKGLGRGLTEAFLRAGANVVTCARTAADTCPEVDGRSAVFVAADLRDPAGAEAVVTATIGEFGRLDICVNSAGGSPPAAAATVSPRFVERIVALNLLAPFYVAQRANAVMQAQDDGGVIINIGSISGNRPSPGTAAYGAAKAGLANLTGSLAMEWAPRVRVNCIVVGYLRTERVELHYGDPAGVAAVERTIPMGRLVEASDVAAACLFLASDPAAYLTGTTIAVHGGGEPPPFLAAARARPEASD
ncbi:MAG TPA: SDR family oxidoreductase [Mycobacteriales bacterium]|nr:SDR family oxidoreductase [Mycobacteriales bacterium]